MAWCGRSSAHPTSTSFIDCVEDDEKQKLCHELALVESQGEAGGLEEYRLTGSRSSLWSASVKGCVCQFSSLPKSTSGGSAVKKKLPRSEELPCPKWTCCEGGPDGEATQNLLRQNRCLKSAGGGNLNDFDVLKTPLCQEIGDVMSHTNTNCCVEISTDLCGFWYGLRSLSQWSVFVINCVFGMSPHSTSAFGGDIDDFERKPDHQKPEEAHYPFGIIQLKTKNLHRGDASTLVGKGAVGADSNYLLSDDLEGTIVQLKRKNLHSGDIYSFGGVQAVGADSTSHISTVLLHTDQSAICDAHVEKTGEASVQVIIELEVNSEGTITVNLDPGERTEALGGLSLLGYKRIIFSVCPALPVVDTDIE